MVTPRGGGGRRRQGSPWNGRACVYVYVLLMDYAASVSRIAAWMHTGMGRWLDGRGRGEWINWQVCCVCSVCVQCAVQGVGAFAFLIYHSVGGRQA